MARSASGVEYVAVEDEPMHHELWRTPTMRVLRAEFPRQSSCLWHEHTRYTVYICITPLDVMEHKLGHEPVPLQLARGHVLVRDHARFPLIHTALTKEDDVMLVGIEAMCPNEELRSYSSHREVSLQATRVHQDTTSEVFRLSLDSGDSITWVLHTEAVVVVLDACRLTISEQSSEPRPVDAIPGSAIPLPVGVYTITIDTNATLFIVELTSR